MYKDGLKSLMTEKFISSVDDFWDLWDPSTVTLMEEVSKTKGLLILKIKPHLVQLL